MEHIRYPNVLNRNFKAEKPMQKIVTDVTYCTAAKVSSTHRQVIAAY